MPAFSASAPTNASGSANDSQTSGRNVARRSPWRRIRPSRPGRSRAASSGADAASIRSGTPRIETERTSCATSCSATGAKRGSWNAARKALPATSSASAHVGSRVPTQPRSIPALVRSVTKLAPRARSAGGSSATSSPSAHPWWRPCTTESHAIASSRLSSSAAKRIEAHDALELMRRALPWPEATVVTSFAFGSLRASLARRSRVEGPGAVADDALAAAGRVARVAEIERARDEPAAARLAEESAERHRAARRLPSEPAGLERLDRAPALRVDPAGRLGVVVVGEVRAHQHERLRPAPEPLEHLLHLLVGGVADRERNQLEATQHRLQERQLHLEAVLARVRRVAHRELGQVDQAVERRAVDA